MGGAASGRSCRPAGGSRKGTRIARASVLLASLDISDENAARRLLARFDAEGWPPIRGVVHAAGLGEVAPLAELTPEDLDRHLRPKAGGAWCCIGFSPGGPSTSSSLLLR